MFCWGDWCATALEVVDQRSQSLWTETNMNSADTRKLMGGSRKGLLASHEQEHLSIWWSLAQVAASVAHASTFRCWQPPSWR